MKTAARAAWAIAPVLVAGLVHVAVLKTDALPWLAIPLDGGRGLLGSNKTLRGLLLMPVATAAATRLQAAIDSQPRPWRSGALLGIAYVAAELPNSFIKRRLGIPAGRAGGRLQYVVDQGDSVVGCLLMLRLLRRPPLSLLATAGVMGFGVHAAVDRLRR